MKRRATEMEKIFTILYLTRELLSSTCKELSKHKKTNQFLFTGQKILIDASSMERHDGHHIHEKMLIIIRHEEKN